MSAACVDTYVVSCNPAPATPASEVVVVRTDHEGLAVTGGEFDPVVPVVAVALLIAGAVAVRRARKAARS